MKRIFLTSGLVLCMACPAFATNPTGGSATTDIPANSNGNNLCVVGTLGTANNGDTTAFAAKWISNYTTISLDVNTEQNGAASNASVAQNPLYADRSDETKMYTDIDGNGTLVNPVNVGSEILSTIPSGKPVNYTLNGNKPTAASGTPSVTQPTAADRTFRGFYSAATGSATRYIDRDGNLEQNGADAAIALAAGASDTWYAQYDCATPTNVTNPTLTGWRFQGWYDDPTNGNSVTPGCIEQNTPLYAHWTQANTTIKYECGKSATNANALGSYTNSGLTDNTNHTNTATYDSPYTHPTGSSVCTLQGYTFSSWYCVEGTTGSTSSGQITDNGIANGNWHDDVQNVTCTAVWTNNVINTTWNGASGTIDANDQGGQNCTYDGNIDLPTVTRAGYTFDGWQATSVTAAGQQL